MLVTSDGMVTSRPLTSVTVFSVDDSLAALVSVLLDEVAASLLPQPATINRHRQRVKARAVIFFMGYLSFL